MICLKCRIGEGGLEVLWFEEGIILQNFLTAGTGGEKLKQIDNPEPVSTNAGAAPAFSGLNGDSTQEIHQHFSK